MLPTSFPIKMHLTLSSNFVDYLIEFDEVEEVAHIAKHVKCSKLVPKHSKYEKTTQQEGFCR